MKPRSGHEVIIESKLFWFLKRYRFRCVTCGEHGRWYENIKVPNSQGWYHDDVTLMNMLTRKPAA